MLSVMIVLLVIVEVICSLLLLVVILLQRSKGQGLGMAIGMEMGESLFGARASDVLVKITIWLGVIFLCTTLALAWLYSRQAQHSGMAVLPMAAPAMPAQAAPGATLPPPQAQAPAAVPTPIDLPALPAPPAEAIPAAPAAPVAPAPAPTE